jgi:hypothetical protein
LSTLQTTSNWEKIMADFTSNNDKPAVHAINTGTGAAIFADGTSGGGLAATSVSDVGVHSAIHSASQSAIFGINVAQGQVPDGLNHPAGNGVWGHTRVEKGAGVVGSVEPGLTHAVGVVGLGSEVGVRGSSATGDGVRGDTQKSGSNGVVGGNESTDPVPPGVPGGHGVFGFSTNPNGSGVFGANNVTSPVNAPGGSGIFGIASAPGAAGVFGANNRTDTGVGVQGNGPRAGVSGFSAFGSGVFGQAIKDAGVIGLHGDPRLQEIQLPDLNKVGVFGASENGAGVMGYASRPGANVFGVAAFGGLLANALGNPLAGKFEGNVQVDGNVQVSGDIFLPGADCAEEFDVADANAPEPATVMVISNNGRLEQSTEAYDKKVAGVVSGAGNHKMGIVLDKKPLEESRRPIALIGKVNCKVDARYSPVEVGDLLTTSPTPGHAMKASDPQKAFGSVIGKALRGLTAGQGIIPILIALQ